MFRCKANMEKSKAFLVIPIMNLPRKKINREIQLIAPASKQTPGQRWETSMQTLRPQKMDRLLVLVDWKNYCKRCYITKNKLQLQHNSHQNHSHILYRTIKPKFISKCKRCQMAHEILSRKSNVLGSTTPALNYSHRNKNSVVLAQKKTRHKNINKIEERIRK